MLEKEAAQRRTAAEVALERETHTQALAESFFDPFRALVSSRPGPAGAKAARTL